VGGARLLQRQGAGYRLLGRRLLEAYPAQGDHSGRPNLSPVVQQDPGDFTRAARASGASADSGLLDQMHGEGEVPLRSSKSHGQNPTERGGGQAEAVH
jgi:hypothetical protein